MAISRSLMNRQLRANGGIMDVTPRENFGLGSSLKKFVRKIIPNEIADIAVKAAPFVAPFNPALAGVMSGVGTFDQTGSIGDSLKAGGMNYAGGQAARYLGGAGFQGNPLAQGGAFTRGGFQGGFSSPLGTSTGLGKFFSNQGVQGVQGLDMATGGADGVGIIPDAATSNVNMITGGADGVGIIQDTIIDKSVVTKEPGFLKNIFDGISNQDYGKVGNTILEGSKKFGKAMFTNKDGSIDKAAVLGAAAFAASYAEARALAADAGVELTEETYDEARKVEKQEEYAGYLTNFFGGQKDGGRIGYEQGANELMSDIIMRGEMGIDDLGIRQQPSTVLVMIEGPSGVEIKEVLESDARKYNLNIVSDSGDFMRGEKTDIDFSSLGKKDGGRINRRLGSPEEGEGDGLMEMLSVEVDAGGDDEEENMLMAYSDAIFDRREKSALFRSLGDPRMQQTTKSFKDLDKILKNPGMFPEDEFMLREYLKLKGFKDGGRIGFESGSSPIRDMAMEMNSGRGPITRIDYISLYEMAGYGDDVATSLGTEHYKTGQAQDSKTAGLKDGGRIGLKNGTGASNRVAQLILERDYLLSKDEDVSYIDIELESLGYKMKAEGGIMEAKIPTGQMRQNNAGVAERDYRQTGGFVPVGIKERADDVPAMLSKNEFVMTADAVRGLGNGSVEEGSKKLYNTMKQAEKVGKA